MKNPNGYGSVYKLSGNRRRPYIAVSPALSVPGKLKKKRTIIGYFEKQKDALNALSEYNKNPDFRNTINNDISLQELFDEFIQTKRFTKLSRQAKDNYLTSWKNYISAIGKMKVRNVKTTHFQEIVDKAELKGLSYSTLSKIKMTEGVLMQFAIQNDYATKNYAEFVELPKAEQKEKTPFSDEQLQTLEKAAAEGILYADLILILCYTGWRINEFLSLKQENYNPENKTLTGGIKTDAGKNRIVPVSDKILPYLQKWIDKGGEYIVCREVNGKLVKVTDKFFRIHWYYPTLEALGLPHLTPHSTRHTFASLLHKKAVDKWDIQRLMGHSSLDVTNKVYTHVDIEQLHNAVNQL